MDSDPDRPADPDVAHLRAVNERLVISGLREQQLAEASEARRAELSALFEALGEGVIVADAAGRLLMVNAAARSLAGIGGADPLTLGAIDRLELRSLEGVSLHADNQPLERAIGGDLFTDEELLLLRPDGSSRRVTVSGRRVAAHDSTTLAIVVLRDVTERRQLEARLAQAERLATLGTLTAGVAHEVNNPLMFILGNVERALEALPEMLSELREADSAASRNQAAKLATVIDALGDAREGSVRIQRIVRALGRVGRVEAGERSLLTLSDVAESALRFTESRVRLCASVRRTYRPTPLVSANAGELEQVFTNLLINAAQAVGEGASEANEIVVATDTDEQGRAVAEIRDTGRGIMPEVLARVFDPFFTTKAVGAGMGLGLSICQSIVQAHGGELSAVGTQGRGATFRLILPPAVARSVIPTPPAPEEQRVVARGVVMVIDDEDMVGRALAWMLERDHDVVVFTDAHAALSRITEGEVFDLILCDLMMPKMTGMEFYEALRETNTEAARRMVLMTGGAFSEAAQIFLSSFPNPVLGKPLDRSALRWLAAEYVEMPRQP